jgi:ribosome-associated translation inhibitor RaiA
MFEKFRFRKFNPTQDIILYANTMLSQVMDVAPDNSNCYASMTKMGNTYTAWIEVTSSEGNFSAESKAEDPRLAVDILDDRIKLKIKKWQSSRRFTEREESWQWPAYDGTYGIFPKTANGRSGLAS